MTIFETNKAILKPYQDNLNNVLYSNLSVFSVQTGIELTGELDLNMVREHKTLSQIAKALNSFGIGVCPYYYTTRSMESLYLNGFTDKTTPKLIYLNIHAKLIRQSALHELIHLIKHLNKVLYANLMIDLETDPHFITYPNDKNVLAELNVKYYYGRQKQDEIVANYFSYNTINDKIPYAFFARLAYNDDKISVPVEQSKYLNMLLEIVKKIKESHL